MSGLADRRGWLKGQRLAAPLASVPARVAHLTPRDLAIGVLLLFVGVTSWWLLQDDRLPDSATGTHVYIAIQYHDAIKEGDLLAPFEQFNLYPPLVHLVGAVSMFVAGVSIEAPIFAQNLLFVPMLVLGCYGAGRIAYGPRVGVLAAVFALGTPMIISQFHAFMLDAPMAAMAAVSVWLLLASDRFRRVGFAAAAGLAVGLGMLTKNTFILFVLGLIVVMLSRGGWRNWRGIAAFCAVAVAFSAPWYLDHLTELQGSAEGSLASVNSESVHPPRWSARNFLWYLMNGLEHQIYLPLATFLGVGALVAIHRVWRSPSRDDLTLELLCGGLFSYLAVTLLNLKDPRYTLPCIVYAAVLATAWLVRRDNSLRVGPAVALILIAAVNTAAVSFGLGGTYDIQLPGEYQTGHLSRKLTLLAPPRFAEGRSEPIDDHVKDLLEATRDAGARQLYVAAGAEDWNLFNFNGLRVLLRMSGLRTPPNDDRNLLGRRHRILVRRAIRPQDPPPCLLLRDGTGLYLTRPKPDPHLAPFERWRLTCPLRRGAAG